jgi:Uncharacterized lipoprotein NlpE involved in copper resistance
VKKAIVAAAALAALIALPGCNNMTDTQTLQPVQAETLKPMQQSWRSVLPCADCEGIETSLFLEKDGSWVMNEHYLGGKGEPSSFASYGSWARTADKLVLTDSKGEKRYYRAKGDALEMLDLEGNPIVSSLNYTLEPVQASLPTTPMAMRGMFQKAAGGATFTDCATGKRVAVADNQRLTQGYDAARGAQSKAVLLDVEGHFALHSSGKMLVADNVGEFSADKRCGD